MKNKLIVLVCTAAISFILFSCTSEEKPQQLSIGLMPAVDSAPMLLAENEGYFADEGLDIEITLYTNAQNRQSGLQSGKIDGAMTDLVALTTNVNSGFKIRGVMMTEGLFPVLAREGSMEKAKVSVGLMEVSVSNFLADRWLKDTHSLEKVYINEIPLRLEAVASGKLDMGVFPEPIASLGAVRGLEKHTYPADTCPDIMVFTHRAIEEKAEAISAFIRGYNRAAEAIRNDEGLARDILVDKIPALNEDVKASIGMPSYPPARLQSSQYIEEIISWTGGIIGEDIELKAGDLIDAGFIETSYTEK